MFITSQAVGGLPQRFTWLIDMYTLPADNYILAIFPTYICQILYVIIGTILTSTKCIAM